MADELFADIPTTGSNADPFADIPVSKEKKSKSLFDVEPSKEKRDPLSFYKVDPREYMKAQSEANLGFLSGLGQDVTGALEAVPGEIGKAGARATKYLKGVGAPETQALGEFTGMMAPAGALFKGISGLGKYIPKAKGALGSAQNIIGGGLSGLTAGGTLGFLKPTGEEDPNKRFKAKQEEAITEAVLGGALGAGARVVGEAANAYKYVQGLIGEAEQLSQSLRGQVGARAGQYIAETEQQIAAANTRLGRITEAVAELEARSALEVEGRALGRALTPEQASKVQRDAIARIRERISASQKAAEDAGLKKGEAAEYVARQEARLLEQKAAAEGITAEYQRAIERGEGMTPVQLAVKIRESAKKIYEKALADRAQVAKFGEAIESAGEELRVGTSNVASKIEDIRKKINNPNIERELNEVSRRLSTSVEGQKEPTSALSVAKADSLRKYLDGLIDVGADKAAMAQRGLDKETVSALRQVRSSLTKEIMSSWEPYKQSMINFAKLSGPVRPFERKGVFAKVVGEDVRTAEQLASEGQIISQVLNRSKGGQFPIAQLIEQEPEMRNALRAYYHRELFAGEKAPTIDRLSGFLKKNEDVLRQTGLYDEFSTINSARKSAQKAIEETEGVIAKGKEAVEVLGGEQARLEKVLKGRQSLLKKAREAEAEARNVPTPQEGIKASEARAKEAAERLAEQRKATLGQKETAEQTVRQYKDMVADLDRAEGPKIAEEAGKIVADLRKRNLINDAEREVMMQKIQIAQQRATNAQEAKKYMRLSIYGGLGLVGAGGISSGLKNQIANIFAGGR
jgi:hypothetical protein